MLQLKGRFTVEHYRKNRKIGEYRFKNGVTNVGLNAILDIMFHGVSQIATWYIGLIDSYGYSALAATDEMSNHGGWAECEDYDEATRPAWAEDAASSQVITNTTLAEFTISGTATLKGLFITSNNTKGGTTGTLWATGFFSSGDVNVEDDDVLKVRYALTASAS